MLIRSAGLVLLFWSIRHCAMESGDGRTTANINQKIDIVLGDDQLKTTDLKKLDIGLVNEYCENNPYQKNDFPLMCQEIEKFNGPIVTESKRRKKLVEEAREAEQSSPSAGKSHREKFVDATPQSEKILGLLEKSSTFMDTLGKFATESKKAAELAKKMSKFTGKLGTVLGSLGTFASFLGPIGAGVGALFSVVAIFLQDDPNEQMQKFVQAQFDKVHERFDKLEIKLDKLDLGVKTTVVYAGYIENQDRIHRVMLSHRTMLRRLSNQTMFEFKEICRTENPLYPIDWIYRHAMSVKDDEFGPHLLPTIFADVAFDRVRLLRFFSIMQADMMKAAYLKEACLGSFYTANDTQLETEVLASRKQMGEMISAVSRKMSWYESKLMTEFQPQLVFDLNGPLNVSKLEGKPLVAEVKNILEQKYFWLEWTIVEMEKVLTFINFHKKDRGNNFFTSVTGDDEGIHHSMVKGNGDRDLFLSWTENIEIVQHSVNDSAIYDGRPNQAIIAVRNAIKSTIKDMLGDNNLEIAYGNKRITPMPSILSQIPYVNKFLLVTPAPTAKNHHSGKNIHYTGVPELEFTAVSTQEGRFPMDILIIYYHSKNATNTIGCNETLSKLKTWGNITDYGDDGSEFNRSITRNDACPPIAFQTKVGEMVKSSLDANPSESNYGKLALAINKTLAAYDDERDYYIHIFSNDTTSPFRHGDINGQPVQIVEHSNIRRKIFVAVIWSFKNDPLLNIENGMGLKQLHGNEFKSNVGEILSACSRLETGNITANIGIVDSCAGHLLEFITSPQVYCTLYNNSLSVLAAEDMNPFVRDAKKICQHEFNFYDNKIVFVRASMEKDRPHYHIGHQPSAEVKLSLNGTSWVVEVFISYYKPQRIANTLQCTMTDKELRQHGITSRDMYYC